MTRKNIQKLLFPDLYDQYVSALEFSQSDFETKLKTSLGSKIDLEYLTQSCAVFSSQIEGNSLDLNSYMNIKTFESKTSTNKDYQQIQDLSKAYEFGQLNPLTEKSFLKAHKISTKTLLDISVQGKYRTARMGVFGSTGIVYLAIEPERVQETMQRFWIEIQELMTKDLSIPELFYYASLIHLVFVHIHPFADGNGRMARLLEKWFLSNCKTFKYSQQIVWCLQSEKYYQKNRSSYYANINLGANYYDLDYSKALPFLKMLVSSL
jgi:Fic family protein